MPRSIKEGLIEARDKIADPIHWTQEAFARSSLGRVIGPNTPGATCWCALGAIKAVTPNDNDRFTYRDSLYEALEHQLPAPYMSIDWFNDTSSHSEVIALFNKAIDNEPEVDTPHD